MKLKLIALSLLVTSSAYANDYPTVQLHPIRILTEHVKEPPHTQLGSKGAMCTASANPASGTGGQMITVNGYVSYSITNNTTVSQNYWADEYMCVNGYGCTHTRDTVTLSAHLNGNGGGAVYNTELLPKGSFVDQSSIQISGESTCFTQGSNTVTMR